MHALRTRTGVLIVGGLLSMVLFLSVPGAELWRKVLQDSAHGPVFAVIAVALALTRRPADAATPRSAAVLLQAFLLAVSLGAAAEVIQHFMPDREMSLLDVLHDAAGATFGLALLYLFERGVRPLRGGVTAILLAIVALVVVARDPVSCAVAYAGRAAQFPVLLQARGAGSHYFLRGDEAALRAVELPTAFARSAHDAALQVAYAPRSQPGLQLFEPAGDWRGYHAVLLDVTNPGDRPLPLVLRIADATTNWATWDRLNHALTVPARSRITVRVPMAEVEAAPRGRPMDLARIADVMVFAPRPAPGTDFYVSRLWLE